MKKSPWKMILTILGVLYFIASILLLIDDLKINKEFQQAMSFTDCAIHFAVAVSK